MWLRRLALILAVGYLIFSIIYLYRVGFSEPSNAIRVGLIGLIVMAVAMLMRSMGKRGKK